MPVELNMQKVMILIQRRYSAIMEISRTTKELEESLIRNDEISVAMILQLRADAMEQADRCMEEIWQMGEDSRENYEKLNFLLTSDPEKSVGENQEEVKIYEIRRKTQTIIEEMRRVDQRLNQRVAGEKSYYRTAQSIR